MTPTLTTLTLINEVAEHYPVSNLYDHLIQIPDLKAILKQLNICNNAQLYECRKDLSNYRLGKMSLHELSKKYNHTTAVIVVDVRTDRTSYLYVVPSDIIVDGNQLNPHLQIDGKRYIPKADQEYIQDSDNHYNDVHYYEDETAFENILKKNNVVYHKEAPTTVVMDVR